jgi:hypothetical protein
MLHNPRGSSWGGIDAEKFSDGGEVEFVKKMIDESKNLGTKIKYHSRQTRLIIHT